MGNIPSFLAGVEKKDIFKEKNKTMQFTALIYLCSIAY